MSHRAVRAARRWADHVRIRQASRCRATQAEYRLRPDVRGQSAHLGPRALLRNLSVLKAAPELAVGPPTIGWLQGGADRHRAGRRRKICAARPRAGADAGRKRRPDRVEQGDRGARHPLAGPARRSCCAARATRSCRSATRSASSSGRLSTPSCPASRSASPANRSASSRRPRARACRRRRRCGRPRAGRRPPRR